MEAAVSAGFKAGAGVDPAGLKLALAAFVAVAMVTWVAWISMGLYQSWRSGSVDAFELQAGIVRATVLAMLVLVLVR
jgi:integrating conjugative element protein (TIGR03758 family)